MTDLFREAEAATPLEPAEREGLRLAWITYRRDLNAAEQQNIAKAIAWARRRRDKAIPTLLSERFVRDLHKRMLGDVWSWAGAYRRSERNIGVAAYRIPVDVIAALRDVAYWTEQRTYPPDEIAVRLHHRLVAIHPFPNGNGRHARLIADLLIEALGGAPFSWGGARLVEVSEMRARYVGALRAADGHDLAPLVAFARS